jgi:hypothetical protein
MYLIYFTHPSLIFNINPRHIDAVAPSWYIKNNEELEIAVMNDHKSKRPIYTKMEFSNLCQDKNK